MHLYTFWYNLTLESEGVNNPNNKYVRKNPASLLKSQFTGDNYNFNINCNLLCGTSINVLYPQLKCKPTPDSNPY